jgi:hypothetical protein
VKKTMSKKMTLTRETIIALTEDRTKAAQGGAAIAPGFQQGDLTGDSKNVCCA